MLIATQNVRGTPNMGDADTNHDVYLTTGQAQIVGWQEMEHANHQRALTELGPQWSTYAPTKPDGSPSGQPISWRNDLYRVVPRALGVDGNSHLLTNAVPGVCDRREVNVVILEEIATGHQGVYACTHFPPKNKPGMPAHAEYAEGVKRLQKLITAWITNDLPFVLLGDFNRQSSTRPLGQTVAGHHLYYRGPADSIDLIITGDSSKLAWDAVGVKTLGGRKSDHKGRRLNASLQPVPAPAPKPVPKPDGHDRYERVTFRGKTVNKWTRAALLACESALGYELTIVQGSYHKGTSASAGTHDGGGVIDLAPFDAARKVRVLREHGFAAWHRLPLPGVWGEHIHAVLIGDTDASPAAQRQVEAYKAGRNGLANNARDDGPRVPIKQFPYPPA